MSELHRERVVACLGVGQRRRGQLGFGGVVVEIDVPTSHDSPIQLPILNLVLTKREKLRGSRRCHRRAETAGECHTGQETETGKASSMDRSDLITLCNTEETGDSAHHSTEDGVRAVEMRLRAQGDEPLAGAGIGARERHAQHRTVVAIHVDLVTNRAARTTEAVAARIAVLHDKVRDHAVPPIAVEEVPVHEPQEVGDRERCVGAEELDDDRPPLLGLDGDLRASDGVGASDETPHKIPIFLDRPPGGDRVCRPPFGLRLRPVLFGPTADEIVGGAARRREKFPVHSCLGSRTAFSDRKNALERGKRRVRKRVATGSCIHGRECGEIRRVGGPSYDIGGDAPHTGIGMIQESSSGAEDGRVRTGVRG